MISNKKYINIPRLAIIMLSLTLISGPSTAYDHTRDVVVGSLVGLAVGLSINNDRHDYHRSSVVREQVFVTRPHYRQVEKRYHREPHRGQYYRQQHDNRGHHRKYSNRSHRYYDDSESYRYRTNPIQRETNIRIIERDIGPTRIRNSRYF